VLSLLLKVGISEQISWGYVIRDNVKADNACILSVTLVEIIAFHFVYRIKRLSSFMEFTCLNQFYILWGKERFNTLLIRKAHTISSEEERGTKINA